MIYYPSYQFVGLQWVCEAIRIREWERVHRGRLDEYRRMMLYHLQWGTPTGPYWTSESLIYSWKPARIIYSCMGPYGMVKAI